MPLNEYKLSTALTISGWVFDRCSDLIATWKLKYFLINSVTSLDGFIISPKSVTVCDGT